MSAKGSEVQTSYSAALLNVALAGSSVWALRLVDPEELYFALTAFGIVLANSLFGVFRYGKFCFNNTSLYKYILYLCMLY